jgi:hypothetical protein
MFPTSFHPDPEVNNEMLPVSYCSKSSVPIKVGNSEKDPVAIQLEPEAKNVTLPVEYCSRSSNDEVNDGIGLGDGVIVGVGVGVGVTVSVGVGVGVGVVVSLGVGVGVGVSVGVIDGVGVGVSVVVGVMVGVVVSVGVGVGVTCGTFDGVGVGAIVIGCPDRGSFPLKKFHPTLLRGPDPLTQVSESYFRVSGWPLYKGSLYFPRNVETGSSSRLIIPVSDGIKYEACPSLKYVSYSTPNNTPLGSVKILISGFVDFIV